MRTRKHDARAGRASARASHEQAFRKFELKIDTLESAAKSSDAAKAAPAARELIDLTRSLGAEVQNLAPPEVQGKFDKARLSLERVVSSAMAPSIRDLAFNAVEWSRITLSAFLKSPNLDVRKLARAKLEETGHEKSRHHHPKGHKTSGAIVNGAWHNWV